ncbi:MAG: PKD domain-containing protein [bacterium]
MAICKKKMWGVFFIVSLIFLLASRTWAASAPNFDFESTTSVAQFSGDLTIGTQGSAIGDIIAVYDASVPIHDGCIGSAVIESTDMVGHYVVNAYGDDDPSGKNGAEPGDTLTFKLWRASEGKLYLLEPVAGGSVLYPSGTYPMVTLNLKAIESGSDPVAYFTYTPASVCASSNVQFTDTSTGDPISWSWNFGDGTAGSTVQNPVHAFSQGGTFTVSLTVTNALAKTHTCSRNIQVTSVPPTAAFSVSATSGQKPLTVTFTDQSTNNPTSWLWNFGDGASSTNRNPSHEFAQAGKYNVTLTVSNACGANTKTSGDIDVSAPPSNIVALFSANIMEGCSPLEVTFSDQSTGNPTAWEWSFGDGTTSAVKNPVHTYTHSGLYTVSLKAKNSLGENILTHKDWIVVYTKPLADFRSDKTVICPSETVKFYDQSSGNPKIWRWNFGDGWISNQKNPEHTYEKPGLYMVRLIATNGCGFSMEQKISFIEVKSPEIDFDTSQLDDCSNLTVQFSADSAEDASNFQWNFGDNPHGTNTGKTPSHTYSRPGTYNVTLTAQTECGQATKTKTVLVRGGMAADFAFSNNPGSVNQVIEFIDRSSGGPTSWHWDFGDPNQGTSTLQNPTYQYTAPGSYTVTLTVTNMCGTRTFSRNIVISSEDTGAIDVENTTVCVNMPARFVHAPPTGVNTWLWDFGDGTGSPEQTTNHTFSSPGTYTVTLRASGQDKSYDYTRMVEVQDTAVITSDADSGCAPLTVHFEGHNAPYDSSVWLWDFGDGTQSTEENPSHTYNQQGNYTVTLTSGCGLSDPLIIEVKEPLQADFTAGPLTGKAPLGVTFQNTSIGATELSWDFGDGEFSNSQTPSHIYQRPGSYQVFLIASNGQCEDEKSVWVDVYTLNSIQGKVLSSHSGTQISGAQIRVLGEDRVCTSSPAGDYSLSGLRPGSYALIVSAKGFETELVQQIRIKLGNDTTQNITLTPAAGSISGVISSWEHGSPIPGAKVTALSTNEESSQPGPDYAHQAVTDSDGKYIIYLGHEDTYRLVVSADDYWSKVDDNQGSGYQINQSHTSRLANIALESKPWQPNVTISSLETQDPSDQTKKRTEIFIYTDQNFSDISMDAADPSGGSFNAPSLVNGDGSHLCYRITYSGYDEEDIPPSATIGTVLASLTLTKGSQTIELPYAFSICPKAIPGQEKCLKRVSRQIVPSKGGRIEGLGQIDLDGDGQMDVYDNSSVELPVCSISGGQTESSLIASLDRLFDPSLPSLFALYRVELMDQSGAGISDLLLTEKNPLIVHLHFDPATFQGSMGDLVIKYQDSDGTWKSGMKNVHLTGNDLIFTTTHPTRFALFCARSAPSTLVLTQDDPDTITELTLKWDDNSEQELSFEIWRCVDEADPKRVIKYGTAPLTTVAANVTSYIDSTCQLDSTYAYKVRALTELGATTFSGHASMQVVECATVPSPPRDVAIKSISKNQVVLTWAADPSCVSGYDIYRRDGESGFQKIGTIVGTDYTDNGLKSGYKYFYMVKAHNNRGDSDPSDEIFVTTDKKSNKSDGMCFVSSLSSTWSALWNWLTGK